MAYTVVKGDTLAGIAKKLGVSLAALEAANPMPNFNRIGVGQQIKVPGQAAPAAAPAVDPKAYQTALSEFGAIGVFAQSNPELNAKLQQAVAEQWDAARFQRELWTTNWYKSLSDTQRQLQLQQVTDPAAYNQSIGNKATSILNSAAGLGKKISQADANWMATQALTHGWDDATLQAYLGENYGNTSINGRLTGSAGDYENHIRSSFAAYGLPVTDQYVTQQVNDIIAGRQTTGGVDNQVIGQASKLYPQYAQDFIEGRTLSQVAAPLIQQMGQTLEIDPSSINLNDPTIMKALQGDGKNPTSIWQFTQQLKADPRWGKTDNAKNAAYDTLKQIGSDWGFM